MVYPPATAEDETFNVFPHLRCVCLLCLPWSRRSAATRPPLPMARSLRPLAPGRPLPARAAACCTAAPAAAAAAAGQRRQHKPCCRATAAGRSPLAAAGGRGRACLTCGPGCSTSAACAWVGIGAGQLTAGAVYSSCLAWRCAAGAGAPCTGRDQHAWLQLPTALACSLAPSILPAPSASLSCRARHWPGQLRQGVSGIAKRGAGCSEDSGALPGGTAPCRTGWLAALHATNRRHACCSLHLKLGVHWGPAGSGSPFDAPSILCPSLHPPLHVQIKAAPVPTSM